jgi:lysophospholipase L1-like esterase
MLGPLMLECLILGDSIAVGTAQFRPDCAVYAKSGINSHNWLNRNVGKNLTAKNVIISLGSNDHSSINTFHELMAIRQITDASHVFWIQPANKPEVAEIVKIIAKNFGDTVLPIPNLSKDGVHPTVEGYKELAKNTKL